MKKRIGMNWLGIIILASALFIPGAAKDGVLADAPEEPAGAPVSPATAACLECHESLHPGVVADWRRSRHARRTPDAALAEPEAARRFSAKAAPRGEGDFAVGCAECHTRSPESHADSFEHNGYRVHPVVTPADCAACHPEEREQYAGNIMSEASGNLLDNPVHRDLVRAGSGPAGLSGGRAVFSAPAGDASDAGCISCHGTRIAVTGKVTRDTDLGPMDFPKLSGWPNQGVGRVNPDGSKGSCAACHARHSFSIALARSPATCGQCHTGPDVPAYKVYTASKHGNIHGAEGRAWNMEAVPWTPGRDFSAPTCAACHVSLLAAPDGAVLSPRSHRMNDRMGFRLFGVVYAHPHPTSPDTTRIRNSAGQPLPADLSGRPAQRFLIDPAEQSKRRASMGRVCTACHGASWVAGHFERLAAVIAETNASTRAATALVEKAWQRGLCRGFPQKSNPFDEPLEREWSRIWLFYANSTRFSAAMAGGGDYGSFADGRFQMNEALSRMAERLK